MTLDPLQEGRAPTDGQFAESGELTSSGGEDERIEDPDTDTLRALSALCTAEAENPDSSVQHRFQRAREILDSADPGDSDHFVPDTFRRLDLIDEKSHVTNRGKQFTSDAGWEPPPEVTAR